MGRLEELKIRNEHWGLYLVLGAFILLATVSSIVVPPFETPDEIWHYAFIQQVAMGGGLPVSEPNTQEMWRQQGGQAPGYYLVAAALTAWIDQSDFPARYLRVNPHAAIGLPGALTNLNYFLHFPDEGWPWQGSILALHISRLFSVLLGAITLWASYRALRLIVGGGTALLGVALFGFIPQFVFISGAASNDNAINATAALVLWQLISLLKLSYTTNGALPPEMTSRRFLLLGLLLGLALLAKVSGLSLLLLTLLVLLLVARRARSWALLARSLGLVLGPALLLAGWWYARNLLLYGDLLALELWESNILLRESPATWRTIVGELESLERSFWGLFGWFNVAYPTWLYTLFRLLVGLLFVGLLLAAVRRARAPQRQGDWRWRPVALLGLWLLALTISWLGFMRIAPAAQGRYFQPAAPLLALLLGVGMQGWRMGPRRPALIGWGVAGGLFLLNLVTPWWVIRPAFTPSSPLAALPAEATPFPVTFGKVLRLEGYRFEAGPHPPGEPVAITLYWRALQPMEENYSVSLKVWGRDWELIARDEGYPDGGRWPTVLWAPGELIADRRPIRLPPHPGEPAVARVELSVYHYETMERLAASIGEEPVEPVHPFFVRLDPGGSTLFHGFDYRFRPVVERVTLEGGQVEVDFSWEVGQMVGRDLQAFLHLTPAPDQPAVAQGDFTPLRGEPPSSLWWFGDRYPDRASLALPEGVPPGEYLLLVGLYDLADGQRVAGEGERSAWTLATLRWDGERWSLVEGES